jgi:hypothetical protein
MKAVVQPLLREMARIKRDFDSNSAAVRGEVEKEL